jgi:SAM-dependent methyltransferase
MIEQRTDKQKVYWEKERRRRSPDHPAIAAFARPKIEYIVKLICIRKEQKILDVGCGNGFFTYYFSEICDPVGLDFSRRMLSINPSEKLVQGTANSLPFSDESFDVVFCSNLLHHARDPRDMVEEMKRVSRGYVILSEPNRNNPLMALFSAIIAEERGALKFSLRYMEDLAKTCGLDVIDSCSMGSIVPNKTPPSMLKLFCLVDWRMPLGFYNLVVAQKQEMTD